MKFFIFGAGFSARAFAKLNKEAVAGTTRKFGKFELLEDANVKPYIFDGVNLSAEIIAELSDTTHLIVSAAPNETGDPVLQVKDIDVLLPKLQWIGYLSTVGVYGDHQGNVVDEESSCKPTTERNEMRVIVEQNWLDLGKKLNAKVAILRLGGIYGAGRNAFNKLKNGTANRIIKPGQKFSRIHSNDIAGVLHYFAQHHLGGIFNVADDEPSPPQDVITYAAQIMGVEPPVEVPFEKADLSPMARSFYGDNKVVSNKKLRQSGYDFKYPNYRDALNGMWRDNSWERE
ncbi:SDR family oxidoreductase [Bartonella sp. HY761]|uniref:SDR family oxidoreductase n=1 Tax=Bartonella sp. HY761 TaxID=2979330 RepID=UPI0022012CC6|nr:SDR family oxidoreductase [Bartonella sp. HY761]UXN06997.1 SDR family oxidoreductase [Bartonella sp. HY761]